MGIRRRLSHVQRLAVATSVAVLAATSGCGGSEPDDSGAGLPTITTHPWQCIPATAFALDVETVPDLAGAADAGAFLRESLRQRGCVSPKVRNESAFTACVASADRLCIPRFGAGSFYVPCLPVPTSAADVVALFSKNRVLRDAVVVGESDDAESAATTVATNRVCDFIERSREHAIAETYADELGISDEEVETRARAVAQAADHDEVAQWFVTTEGRAFVQQFDALATSPSPRVRAISVRVCRVWILKSFRVPCP